MARISEEDFKKSGRTYKNESVSSDKIKSFKLVKVEVIKPYGDFKVGHKSEMYESTANALKLYVKILK